LGGAYQSCSGGGEPVSRGKELAQKSGFSEQNPKKVKRERPPMFSVPFQPKKVRRSNRVKKPRVQVKENGRGSLPIFKWSKAYV